MSIWWRHTRGSTALDWWSGPIRCVHRRGCAVQGLGLWRGSPECPVVRIFYCKVPPGAGCRDVLERLTTAGGGGYPPPVDPDFAVRKTKFTEEDMDSDYFWYTNVWVPDPPPPPNPPLFQHIPGGAGPAFCDQPDPQVAMVLVVSEAKIFARGLDDQAGCGKGGPNRISRRNTIIRLNRSAQQFHLTAQLNSITKAKPRLVYHRNPKKQVNSPCQINTSIQQPYPSFLPLALASATPVQDTPPSFCGGAGQKLALEGRGRCGGISTAPES